MAVSVWKFLDDGAMWIVCDTQATALQNARYAADALAESQSAAREERQGIGH